MTLPNPPHEPPQTPPAFSGPDAAWPDTPTQAIPAVVPPAKKGWPGGAKVTAIVLAITTLGAAAAGVVLSQSAKSDTDDVKKELAAARKDLKDTAAELKDTTSQLEEAKAATDSVTSDLESVKSDLAQAQSDRDTAQGTLATTQGQLDSLTALFPFGLDDMAQAPLAGTYQLTISGSPSCSGYADNDAACSANSLPATMTIEGDAQNGYSVTLGATVVGRPLLSDGAQFSSNGTVEDAAADLCNGDISVTTFTAKVAVIEVALVDGTLQPTRVVVDLSLGAAEANGCSATNRTVSYDGTPG